MNDREINADYSQMGIGVGAGLHGSLGTGLVNNKLDRNFIAESQRDNVDVLRDQLGQNYLANKIDHLTERQSDDTTKLCLLLAACSCEAKVAAVESSMNFANLKESHSKDMTILKLEMELAHRHHGHFAKTEK